MPQAVVRIINHKGATFIELPEINFNGREILVRVLPTDDPAHLAVTCMQQIKNLMTRESIAAISSSGILAPSKKIIKPN